MEGIHDQKRLYLRSQKDSVQKTSLAEELTPDKFVYIVKNRSLPGMVKIGMAKDVEKRMHSLSSGHVFDFEIVGSRKFENAAAAEHEIHERLAEYRVSPRKEFFSCSEDLAISTLLSVDATEFSENSNSKSPQIHAKRLVVSLLRRGELPRVITIESLIQCSKTHLGIELPEPTAKHNLATLKRDGLVTNPMRGLYLNTQSQPTPTVMELAQHMRKNAVVSLHTVLSQRGILNKPTNWVMCVIPRGRTSPVTGRVDVDGTTFSFSSMNQAAMCSHLSDLALQSGTYAPTATPEKALLDWIYLAKNSRRWTMPDRSSIDLDALDMGAMDTLAHAMSIESEWVEFRDRTTPTPVVKKPPFKRPR